MRPIGYLILIYRSMIRREVCKVGYIIVNVIWESMDEEVEDVGDCWNVIANRLDQEETSILDCLRVVICRVKDLWY